MLSSTHRTRFGAHSQTCSIHCPSLAGLSSRRPSGFGLISSPVASGASSLRSGCKANTGWMCGSLQVPHGAYAETIRHSGGGVCGLHELFGTSS